MAYERNRVNTDTASNEVVVKKSTLTALAIAIFVLLAVIFLMVWQNYEQNEQLNDLSNHQTLTTTPAASQQ